MVRGVLPVPKPADIMYSPLNVAVAVSEQLDARGHKVTFFGSSDDGLKVSAFVSNNLHPVVLNNRDWQALLSSTDLFTDYIPSLYDQVLVQQMFERGRKGEFDILHFHHPETAMPYARLYPKVPVVYTLHDQLDDMRREIIEEFVSANQHFISISNSQRRGAPDLPYTATVYNGIDTSLFRPDGEETEDYLLVVSRIVPYKGIKEAIDIANQTGLRLLIIGQVQDADKWYFENQIKPFLNDKILFLGLLEAKQLVKYYQKAKALLMPVFWEEPFGLSMIEAMACGTPVIALRRGSIPEVVADGRTGFICDSIGDMVKAVEKLDTIKRPSCRQHILRNFSNKHMVDGYESAFRKIIEDSRLLNTRRLSGRISNTAKRVARRANKPIRIIKDEDKSS